MKIGEGFKEWFHSTEKDPQKRLNLLAFHDFCFDLFEEEFGRVPQGEETDPGFVRASSFTPKRFLPFDFKPSPSAKNIH